MHDDISEKIKKHLACANIRTYTQRSELSCGPASLKIILDSFGGQIDESELMKLAKTDNEGTTPNNLCLAAASLGYRTFQRMNASFEDVEHFVNAGVPVIVNYQSDDGGIIAVENNTWDEGHYAVVCGATNTELLLSDPAKATGGYKFISKNVFSKAWHDEDISGKIFNHWLMVVFPKKMQVVQAEGNNYDIGFAVGQQCKLEIQGMLQYVHNDYESRMKKDFSTFIKASKKFLKYGKDIYPEYVRELEGMADGAELDFDELFTLSCTEELDWSSENALLEKCSSFIAKVNGDVVLAHNEDYAIYPTNPLYILKAKQKGKPDFLSNGYVGSLAGSSAGINSEGIAMSGNSIGAPDCRFGILKNFVCRKILDESSVDSAVKNVEKTKRAIGGNYNIVSQDESVFVETFARKIAVISIDNLPACHTNHCISEKLKGKEAYISESSTKRFARMTECLSGFKNDNLSLGELKRILRNHDDWPISICRHEYESDSQKAFCSNTLASIILNPTKGTIEFASGNPCRARYINYEL